MEKYGAHECNVGEDGGFAPNISRFTTLSPVSSQLLPEDNFPIDVERIQHVRGKKTFILDVGRKFFVDKKEKAKSCLTCVNWLLWKSSFIIFLSICSMCQFQALLAINIQVCSCFTNFFFFAALGKGQILFQRLQTEQVIQRE